MLTAWMTTDDTAVILVQSGPEAGMGYRMAGFDVLPSNSIPWGP